MVCRFVLLASQGHRRHLLLTRGSAPHILAAAGQRTTTPFDSVDFVISNTADQASPKAQGPNLQRLPPQVRDEAYGHELGENRRA